MSIVIYPDIHVNFADLENAIQTSSGSTARSGILKKVSELLDEVVLNK